MFDPLEARDVDGEVHHVELDEGRRARSHIVERGDELDAWRLDEAELVVLLGPDGGSVAETAAAAREAGAAFGVTRERCERGDAPWDYHVGLFGRPVAPRVLVAVGVPGGFEQLTGFVKAGVVVALPEANWPADVQVAEGSAGVAELVNRVAAAL